jgi:hypothetical protein
MEPAATTGRRHGRRLALLVATVAVLCLVLALSSDPGSGTATNLQPAADAAGLVVGAHHAKPLPTTGTALLGLVLAIASIAAAVARLLVVDVAPVVERVCRAESARMPRQLSSWTARTWRAPPSPVA